MVSTVAPSARADVIDGMIDAILAPFTAASTATVDGDALASPTAWDVFLTATHWNTVHTGLSGPGGGAAGAAAASAPVAADFAALFQQLVYAPIHTGSESWINSSVGEQIDNVLNQPFIALTGRALIDDGAAGTAAHPDGDAGGWLFGDGGAG